MIQDPFGVDRDGNGKRIGSPSDREEWERKAKADTTARTPMDKEAMVRELRDYAEALRKDACSRKFAADVMDQAADLLERDGWVSVKESLPEAGQQVAALRNNGTWDRAECNPIYFDGLPAWYLPEGPTPSGDDGVTHWYSIAPKELPCD